MSSMKAGSPYGAIKERLQDDMAGFIAWLPTPLQRLVIRGFRRPILWWVFRAYGTSLALTPAGPRDSRFQMWLDPSSYSDFILGIYEPGCTNVLRQYAREGSLCVDVGANLGYFSIFMSRLVGGRGQVIAFEPMPDTVEILQKNVRVNDLRNVTVVQAAAGDVTGSVEFFSEQSQSMTKTASMLNHRFQGAARTTIVPSIRLDDYFVGAARYPDFIKIDVEGAEESVLNGARETLARSSPALVVEIHRWGSPESQRVLSLLSELGYSAHIFEIRMPEALCLATRASATAITSQEREEA
jgi:FkbM family methyltransferase